jgi:hypothetical protein
LGPTSTTEKVLSGVNLRDKRILVTRVSAGLGAEAARSLAAHGAQVAGSAREIIISGTPSNCQLFVDMEPEQRIPRPLWLQTAILLR